MTAPTAGAAHNIWAVVPVKRFSHAKLRLVPALSDRERAALARTMLHDVLSTLSGVPQLAGVLIVSGDPSATELAHRFGMRVVDDGLEAGVNMAVAAGLEALRDELGAGAMIVPADVPFATAAEFKAVLRALERAAVVLVPAESDGGTNCLAMRTPDLMAPQFGDGSLARHQGAAHEAGLGCDVCRLEGLGRDIDRPEDLLAAPRARASTRTGALLDEFGVAARLRAGASGRPMEPNLK